MKIIGWRIYQLIICIIMLGGFFGCSLRSASDPVDINACPSIPAPVIETTEITTVPVKPDWVELIYFHTRNPCHCMAVVEENIRFAIEDNFKDEMTSGRVKLTSIVSDDPANIGMVKKYNAMLFALFIREIRGDHERVYPVYKIWEMTGDNNRDKLVLFITDTITAILEGRS